MKISFDGIRFRNFLSTGDAFNAVPLNNDELTVIVGRNGCGKSTVIDAIVFALFGRAFRKIKKGQLINSINKKNCCVELAFSRGNDRYLIRRGIKLDKQANVFEIYKNRELIPEDSIVGSYQQMLERDIIGVGYKTFCQVNILGKAGYTPYMQLEARDRRIVVDELLESEVFTKMNVIGTAQMKTLKAEASEIDTELQVIRAKIIGQERLINRQETDTAEQDEAKRKIIERGEARLKQLTEEIKAAETVVRKNEEALDDLSVDPTAVEDMLVDIQVSISTANSQISSERVKVKRVMTGDSCPSCLQKIDHTHREKIECESQQVIEAAEAEVAKLEKRLPKLKAIKSDIEKLQSALADSQQVLRSLARDYRHQEEVNDDHEVELADMLSRKAVDNTGDQEELKKLNVELEKIVDRYDAKKLEIEVLKQSLSYLGDDGVLKMSLIDKYVPKINELINQYLDQMNLFVQFELDNEFNETIKSRHRDAFTYESFSEGEKLRIDLAIMLTWRQIAMQRNSSPTNLLIMDEIFDGSMDDAGVAELLAILQSMDDTRRAYIITHKTNVSDELIENVITATKTGNFTSYEF